MSRLKSLLAALPRLTVEEQRFTPTEFTLFDKLPTELCYQIWDYAAMEGRTIKIFPVLHLNKMFNDVWDSNVEDQTRQPGIMGICFQSRERGKRVYKLVADRGRRTRAHFLGRKVAKLAAHWSRKLHLDVAISKTRQLMGCPKRAWRNYHWINFEIDEFCFSFQPSPESTPFYLAYSFKQSVLKGITKLRFTGMVLLGQDIYIDTGLMGLTNVNHLYIEFPSSLYTRDSIVESLCISKYLNSLGRRFKKTNAERLRRLKAPLKDLRIDVVLQSDLDLFDFAPCKADSILGDLVVWNYVDD